MFNLNVILDTLTTFPIRSAYGRYLNGLIHGGAAIALMWMMSFTLL